MIKKYKCIYTYNCILSEKVLFLDESITARLDKKDISTLDKLVELGYFSSRSEAIITNLSKGIKELLEKDLTDDLITEIAEEPKLSDEELLEIGKMLLDRPLSEIVAEGRE